MSKQRTKRELVGPWRNLHTAIWLVGLAILFWRGWFWPGILVLIALSLILEALLAQFAPQAFEDSGADAAKEGPPAPPEGAYRAVPDPHNAGGHRMDLLPSTCPKCGAPVRGEQVKWTGAQSADCPYCGANLPLKTEPIKE